VCHGAFGPASAQFSAAGTVYEAAGEPRPAVGAAVRIEDVKGSTDEARTNAAGNFYLFLGDFNPTFPIRTEVTSADGSMVQTMQSYVARNGSCAACHTDPPGATSAGHVVLSPGAADAGTKG